jgi:hypothetical protein
LNQGRGLREKCNERRKVQLHTKLSLPIDFESLLCVDTKEERAFIVRLESGGNDDVVTRF